MDLKAIKKLVEVLEDSSLESLTYKDETFEVEIKKPKAHNVYVEKPPLTQTLPQHYPEDTAEANVKEMVPLGHVIRSPLVGVYYSKPTPESSEFTAVGKRVNKGDVVCIIEAMKVMNEIKSDVSGTLLEVHIKDGDSVDFDQPLFTIQEV
ncbi:hypothetical protein AOC36_10545 [Erysipelothrix larvae]|uniref:Biotin carboxyl carrier protein of acetyl-CoA carboxylase n=1 Tax=Erysipelothrix larvae TaxID=1514105 RepID=A0A109UHM9_9FIRM|nr:acetyl-CoA carboxylase biotin carboxyl carrier protein [Erysipelothrix larvae]AMC94393.1 hypothetical protein AOC36_10545 [Erysipelothrix larvae]